MTSPMVPDTDWGGVAQGFSRSQGRQTILCAQCVFLMGDVTPPPHVVIYGGQSLCLDHLPRPERTP